MKKITFPTAQTILFILAALVTLLTWYVPAGKYDTLRYDSEAKVFIVTSDNGEQVLVAEQASLSQLGISIAVDKFINGDIWKPVAIPNTYQPLEANPQGLFDLLKAPVKGIIQAADIIVLVLFIGGLVAVTQATGAFESGIAKLAKSLQGREYVLIIIVTILMAAGGTTFGLAEETIAFYPILIPIFLAARYDAMVPLACIFIGSGVGTMCSTVNPFSAVIASDAAGINWTSGTELRFILLAVTVITTILYVIHYGRKVQNDPSKSIIADYRDSIETHFGVHVDAEVKLTTRQVLILLTFITSFVVMVVGVSSYGWWFAEMSTVFLVAAIMIALIGKIKESVFIETFVKGASTLLGVSLIIGIARGVTILMDDGLISDTILYHASMLTEGVSGGVFINILLYVYAGLSFFVPSTSGMAVLTMPIMAPLADTVNVSRELVVSTYMFGVGLFSMINPTSLILATLAIVKVGFDRWLKFIMPLLIIFVVQTMIAITIAVYI